MMFKKPFSFSLVHFRSTLDLNKIATKTPRFSLYQCSLFEIHYEMKWENLRLDFSKQLHPAGPRELNEVVHVSTRQFFIVNT